MSYFEWADDMVIDRGPIDQDHMNLVNLVNELHTATSEGRGHEVVDDILKRLITYTLEHLDREERFLASVNFPNLAQHQRGHQAFAKRLNGLKARYDDGSITVASQLSTVLRDWLSLHIRREDKEVLDHIKATERAKRRAT